ncbi:MAG: hypothetical protein Q9199_001352 [Rusavskia elegans]
MPNAHRRMIVKSSEDDLKNLVMDYLIREGYPNTAQKLASEASIQPPSAADSIHERVAIREAIYRGDIQSAIQRINDLEPMARHSDYLQIFLLQSEQHTYLYFNFIYIVTTNCNLANSRCKLLEKDETLHFALLRLQLVELIRSCGTTSTDDPTPAINFATTELAPRAATNPQFLEDLERTMTLLMFEHKDLPPQYTTLLDRKLRVDVALRVNEALFTEQGERTKTKLSTLIHLRAWVEQKALEANKELPAYLKFRYVFDLDGRGKEHDGMQSSGEAVTMDSEPAARIAEV